MTLYTHKHTYTCVNANFTVGQETPGYCAHCLGPAREGSWVDTGTVGIRVMSSAVPHTHACCLQLKFLQQNTSVESVLQTISVTMDGDRMTVKTRVKLQAASPKDKSVLYLMQDAFRRLDACEFDFIQAAPFASARAQQVAAEWVTTLTECEEDTMQARVRRFWGSMLCSVVFVDVFIFGIVCVICSPNLVCGFACHLHGTARLIAA